MSEYIIPVPNEPDTKFSVVLDNRAYDIRLQWNGRDQAWYMYLAITNNTPFMKVKVKTNTDLLRPYLYNSLCPKGVLTVLDSEKVHGRIDRDAWKGRFKLHYLTPDEI